MLVLVKELVHLTLVHPRLLIVWRHLLLLLLLQAKPNVLVLVLVSLLEHVLSLAMVPIVHHPLLVQKLISDLVARVMIVII